MTLYTPYRDPPMKMSSEDRKLQILQHAMKLSEIHGFTGFSSLDIAKSVGIGHPLIFHHFGTMNNLRADLMRLAVSNRNMLVLAQGVVARNPIALAAPESLKKQALNQ